MKKTMIMLLFVLGTIGLFARGSTYTEITKIYDGITYLSPSATTWTVVGSIVTTSTSFTVNAFNWDCDTLSFIAEVSGSASIIAGETDSVALDLRLIPTSPSGLQDSTAWATWLQALAKSTTGGAASFGSALTFTKSSHTSGAMKVLIGLKSSVAESVTLKIWRVRKWRSP